MKSEILQIYTIQQFKGVTPRKWWQEVKRLNGMKSTNVNVINQIDIEEFSNLTLQEQVNSINPAFLSPLEEYRMSTPLERRPLEDFGILKSHRGTCAEGSRKT